MLLQSTLYSPTFQYSLDYLTIGCGCDGQSQVIRSSRGMGNGQFDRLANGQILRLDVAVEADVDISNLGHGVGKAQLDLEPGRVLGRPCYAASSGE